MASRTVSAESTAAKTMGECPKPKYGFGKAMRERDRWGLARLYKDRGEFGNAGIMYAEAGRQTAALKMVRKLLSAPENGEGDSNILEAARIIIALHKATQEPKEKDVDKATGKPTWIDCAKRMAEKAKENGNEEDAALIYREAGFLDDAAKLEKGIRFTQWGQDVK